MQTQQRTTDGFWPFHDHFRDWLHRDLPALNRAAEDGHLSPEEFVTAVRPWINDLGAKHVPGVRQISRWEARKLIQLVGFPVSSVERHFQAAGAAPGTGLSRLPGVDHMLRELARVAHHPPRDSHYTYWLWNTGDKPLTFTGDPQEVFFNMQLFRNDFTHGSKAAIEPLVSD